MSGTSTSYWLDNWIAPYSEGDAHGPDKLLLIARTREASMKAEYYKAIRNAEVQRLNAERNKLYYEARYYEEAEKEIISRSKAEKAKIRRRIQKEVEKRVIESETIKGRCNNCGAFMKSDKKKGETDGTDND